jgi:nucleoside-diphosphate-sugar epimerase
MITVTGASGFVGQALCAELLDRGYSVRAVVRSENALQLRDNNGLEVVAVGEIGANTDWTKALIDTDCVIHCAARAHVMHETAVDALAAYRAVNVAGTRRLAEQAQEFSVKRMIYLSSIKVNGEQTQFSRQFKASDNAAPEDPYGISKWEAEQVLWEVAAKSVLEIAVVRPPLVYGPGVKGNFLTLLRWLDRGLPMPFGAVHNRRSLVGIDNLIDLLITCVNHPGSVNQTFLVSDDEDLSTGELMRRLGKELDKPARLLSVPLALLEFAASLLNKRDIAQRLLGNLQVDISKTKELLGWSPPDNVDEGLRKTAEWYQVQR